MRKIHEARPTNARSHRLICYDGNGLDIGKKIDPEDGAHPFGGWKWWWTNVVGIAQSTAGPILLKVVAKLAAQLRDLLKGHSLPTRLVESVYKQRHRNGRNEHHNEECFCWKLPAAALLFSCHIQLPAVVTLAHRRAIPAAARSAFPSRPSPGA